MHQDFHTTYRQFSCVDTPSITGKKHVALIYAGMSTERDVSISSAQGIEKALVSLGYQVTSIDMGADIAQVLSEIKPDVVFNALHGTYGEDGCLQGLLNILRIPYTHSGLLSSAIAFNKVKSKQFFDAHQMLQAKSILIHSEQKVTQDPMPRPYVIKPISQGSSVGVELVFEGDEFDFSTYTFPYGDIIVEQYIKGREMQVAVLNGEALGALEIQLINKRFYDYEAKYSEGFTKHLMPAPIPQDAYNKLMSLAKQAYTIMGCNGIARVEFIYDEKNNDFYLLEINTHPGFTPLSICPEIAAYMGISFDQLVEELLRTAHYEL